MQNIFIIGATSAIAEATARLYAARGARLFLIARNPLRLHDIALDLRTRGCHSVDFAVLDINDIGAHEAALTSAWNFLGTPDVVLIAHGTLPDQKACEASVEIALAEFNTNATSTIAMVTLIANRLQQTGKGSLAVISSVAGDRGRASNYLYGAAKAAVSTYLSGLRQRLNSLDINVLTIKPGFVDTPMTREFKKGVLWVKPPIIAKGIVRAMDKNKSVCYLPSFWFVIMLVIRSIPEYVFRRINL